MIKPLPSQDDLNRLLAYDPGNGKLWWRERMADQFEATARRTAEHMASNWNAQNAGSEAFTAVDRHGYRYGTLLGVTYFAHRVIFKMVTGEEPEEIDHADHDGGNNRWANIEGADHAANMRNHSQCRRNTSGVTGVCWDGQRDKWQVHARRGGRSISLGRFQDFAVAVATRKEFERANGYHVNHGYKG